MTVSEANQDWRHSLIIEKAYTEGALTLPSKLACDVFEKANADFIANRDQFSKAARCLDKFINWLRDDIVANFQDFPLCHLELLLTRFFKIRMFFWASFLDAELQKMIKEQKNKTYDSRAMTGYQLNKR